jgi:hypothetical protein
MKFLIPITIAFAALLFASCATSPVDPKIAKGAPAERIYPVSFPSAENGGSVIFVRDSGATGSLGKAYISIDSQDVVALLPGEKFEIKLPKGNYVLMVRAMESKASSFSRPRSSSVFVESGRSYIYRIGWLDGQSLQIEPWGLK